MREIKFRFWDKTRQKMFYKKDCATLWIGLDGELKAIDCDAYPLCNDEFELQQYTGLRDKNGVEIYEGDVVRAITKFDGGYQETIGIIGFAEKRGYFGFILDGFTNPLYEWDEFEVIGNIYENNYEK